jgi:hypothetical protein
MSSQGVLGVGMGKSNHYKRKKWPSFEKGIQGDNQIM